MVRYRRNTWQRSLVYLWLHWIEESLNIVERNDNMKFEYIFDQRTRGPALFISYSELMKTKDDIESTTCLQFAMNSFCCFCNSALEVNKKDIDYLRNIIKKGENVILCRFSNPSSYRCRYESIVEIACRGMYGDRIAIGPDETGDNYFRIIE